MYMREINVTPINTTPIERLHNECENKKYTKTVNKLMF